MAFFSLIIESVTMVTTNTFNPITTKRIIYVISDSKTDHTNSVSLRNNRWLRFQLMKLFYCMWQIYSYNTYILWNEKNRTLLSLHNISLSTFQTESIDRRLIHTYIKYYLYHRSYVLRQVRTVINTECDPGWHYHVYNNLSH